MRKRMKNKRYILVLLAMLSVWPCCRRVQPQGAANKPVADSAALALMEMNFLMALDANQLLIDSVRASGLPYVLDNRNVWYYRLSPSEGRQIEPGMHVEYSAVIRDLATGALLEDITEETEVGKRAVLDAIDIVLPYMRVGETFHLLAPFYNAYGRDGKDNVPPLTNVKILLTVNNITKI